MRLLFSVRTICLKELAKRLSLFQAINNMTYKDIVLAFIAERTADRSDSRKKIRRFRLLDS